ncbi:MAG: molybdopterin-dependent oxidoreductase [Anaerolineae bacterium]|nr:molybdopterin-dependent oxidoreductase [Anaerolineae bacterium]
MTNIRIKPTIVTVIAVLLAATLIGCTPPVADQTSAAPGNTQAAAPTTPPAMPTPTATLRSATPTPSVAPGATPSPTSPPPTAPVTTSDYPCDLTRWIAPTPPPVSYSFGELDPATGLHVTGNAREIDPVTWRLEITGSVDSPLMLALDQIRCMPRQEQHCTLVCPETFEDTTTWAGPRLWDVLSLAGLPDEVSSIRLIGADGYGAWIPVSVAQAEDSLLAYEWQGEPLPILHGFPLRGVFPESPGYMWVKWLVRIEIQ